MINHNTQMELGTYVSQENLVSNNTQTSQIGGITLGSNDKQLALQLQAQLQQEADNKKMVTEYII